MSYCFRHFAVTCCIISAFCNIYALATVCDTTKNLANANLRLGSTGISQRASSVNLAVIVQKMESSDNEVLRGLAALFRKNDIPVLAAQQGDHSIHIGLSGFRLLTDPQFAASSNIKEVKRAKIQPIAIASKTLFLAPLSDDPSAKDGYMHVLAYFHELAHAYFADAFARFVNGLIPKIQNGTLSEQETEFLAKTMRLVETEEGVLFHMNDAYHVALHERFAYEAMSAINSLVMTGDARKMFENIIDERRQKQKMLVAKEWAEAKKLNLLLP